MSAMMATTTAMCVCTMGKTPVPLVGLSAPTVLVENKPAVTIMDNIPFANVAPFGACNSPANPAVVAAAGSPVPCTPALAAPWVPGQPKVLIKGKPALNNTCQLICTLGGVISMTAPGTTHTMC